MSQYSQYCPISLAAEILCVRWNILIIRRFIEGCSRFNDIHRGIPKVTPALLSSRLGDLEAAEIISKTPLKNAKGYEYHLTEAGEALEPIVKSFAVWGQEWGRDMMIEDLDPEFLLWQMHARLNTNAMPAGRTVIALEFSGLQQGNQRFWLINNGGDVDMCLKHPGFDPDITIMADIRLFIEAWRGIRCVRHELAMGTIRTDGSKDLIKALPDILLLSEVADVKRRKHGKEYNISQQNS